MCKVSAGRPVMMDPLITAKAARKTVPLEPAHREPPTNQEEGSVGVVGGGGVVVFCWRF